ncbi:hypothetical protein pb186bvf_019175 [Paramecium bursaria]
MKTSNNKSVVIIFIEINILKKQYNINIVLQQSHKKLWPNSQTVKFSNIITNNLPLYYKMRFCQTKNELVFEKFQFNFLTYLRILLTTTNFFLLVYTIFLFNNLCSKIIFSSNVTFQFQGFKNLFPMLWHNVIIVYPHYLMRVISLIYAETRLKIDHLNAMFQSCKFQYLKKQKFNFSCQFYFQQEQSNIEICYSLQECYGLSLRYLILCLKLFNRKFDFAISFRRLLLIYYKQNFSIPFL